MNSKEKILSTIEFRNNENQVPRDLWTLPWFENRYPEEMSFIKREYPSDIVSPDNLKYSVWPTTKGDPYEVGEYTDEWGCVFQNLQKGIIGEVKSPVIDLDDEDWDSVSRVHIPEELLSFDIKAVNEWCRNHNDKFIKAACCPRPFEQMQFIRGTENLYVDLVMKPPKMFAFLKEMHEYYCRLLEKWCQTDVDAIMFMDDWGSQKSLLINPEQWREIFKPMYRDYIEIARKYGKKTMMHSDGYILDIIPDLIEIGLDILNCQIFCMGVENLEQFRGKITFWGELDRQHLLPEGSRKDIRNAVTLLRGKLFEKGGFILQMEAGPGAKVENVLEALKTNDDLNVTYQV